MSSILAQEVFRMSEVVDDVTETKEKLRIALVNEGFDIPKGLKLKDWIPCIEKGSRL